ncbi:MAG: hypothetical protein KF799_12280 [Bdellovibrionales bacterium]|nr:hypothetical protein [Bdellovibrionales bacterium]
MKPFRTVTYGKWILAGEHAVLRGCPALAFPLTTCSLELEFIPTSTALEVEFSGPHGEELKLLFYGVLENALSRLKVNEPPQGRFVLRSSLPVGAGLGASAALCGAVARWCEAQTWIQTSDVYEFARRLEDLFHGESSGVDLAVSLSSQGVRFVRGGERLAIHPTWWPRLYLSYCGSRGMTSDCVNKVKRLFETDPERARRLDERMRQAVELAQQSLLNTEPEGGFRQLREALQLGQECFQSWGLSGGDLGSHLQMLEGSGACAAKPTGSGGGGYALSLWDREPPAELKDILLPVPRPPI